MSRVRLDEVLRVLRRFPEGATTKQLADVLSMRPATLGSRLSKAFMYGRGVDYIERPAVFGREYVWRAE